MLSTTLGKCTQTIFSPITLLVSLNYTHLPPSTRNIQLLRLHSISTVHSAQLCEINILCGDKYPTVITLIFFVFSSTLTKREKLLVKIIRIASTWLRRHGELMAFRHHQFTVFTLSSTENHPVVSITPPTVVLSTCSCLLGSRMGTPLVPRQDHPDQVWNIIK